MPRGWPGVFRHENTDREVTERGNFEIDPIAYY